MRSQNETAGSAFIVSTGLIFFMAAVFAAMGCAHRETQASRDRLNCEYRAMYDKRLTSRELVKALEACR